MEGRVLSVRSNKSAPFLTKSLKERYTQKWKLCYYPLTPHADKKSVDLFFSPQSISGTSQQQRRNIHLENWRIWFKMKKQPKKTEDPTWKDIVYTLFAFRQGGYVL